MLSFQEPDNDENIELIKKNHVAKNKIMTKPKPTVIVSDDDDQDYDILVDISKSIMSNSSSEYSHNSRKIYLVVCCKTKSTLVKVLIG